MKCARVLCEVDNFITTRSIHDYLLWLRNPGMSLHTLTLHQMWRSVRSPGELATVECFLFIKKGRRNCHAVILPGGLGRTEEGT